MASKLADLEIDKLEDLVHGQNDEEDKDAFSTTTKK